jgi:hypothetical protein
VQFQAIANPPEKHIASIESIIALVVTEQRVADFDAPWCNSIAQFWSTQVIVVARELRVASKGKECGLGDELVSLVVEAVVDVIAKELVDYWCLGIIIVLKGCSSLGSQENPKRKSGRGPIRQHQRYWQTSICKFASKLERPLQGKPDFRSKGIHTSSIERLNLSMVSWASSMDLTSELCEVWGGDKG